MMACPAISDTTFLSSTLAHIDCQALTLGEQGYLALSTASTLGLVMSGALALFIALIGYRLLLGESVDIRDGVVAVVKIGFVLMLATSWPAFRTLVYNVAFDAPGELASSVAFSTGLTSDDGLVAQLQVLDDGMSELMLLGTGQPSGISTPARNNELSNDTAQNGEPAPPTPVERYQQRWDPARDASLLANARTIFLTVTIAAFAAARLVAGLALTLAPLFILFLLFNGTRSLVEGWIRVLVGAALGAFAVNILLGIEVALVAPWLSSVLALRYQNISTPAVPIELLVLSVVFGLVLLAGLAGGARIGYAFRLAPLAERLRSEGFRMPGHERAPAAWPAVAGREVVQDRSRAMVVADAVATAQRREATDERNITVRDERRGNGTGPEDSAGASNVPLGQSFRRRTRGRISSGSRKRDQAA